METAVQILKYLFGKIISIVGILFAVLYFAKHEVLQDFFNKRAGCKIITARVRGRVEKIALIIGAIVGTLQWFEAIGGDVSMGLLNILALSAGIVYLNKLRKKMDGVLEPTALRWALIYKGCVLWMFYVGGALLSIFAILIFIVLPIFFKGMDFVWNDTFSYSNPSKEGVGIRSCRTCQYWSAGYCSFHNQEMPATGGCGNK
ncbi:MAG: hypothetical protein IKY57_00400 [Alistipes sp.]|nr:hypothetical protein [Alistipes sp.]